MLPHQSMLNIPSMKKHVRRTLHMSTATYDRRSRVSTDDVYVRELNVTAGGLGCSTWDGSIILARYLLQCKRDELRGKTVLELGAGTAVPSLVAARYADRVVVTDYLDELLQNTQYNLQVNASADPSEENELTAQLPAEEQQHIRAERQRMTASLRTAFLDWHVFEDVPTDDDESEQVPADELIDLTTDEDASDQELPDSSRASSSGQPASGTAVNRAKPSTQPEDITSIRHILHHNDPLHPHIHRHEADIILGSEILYTENTVHAYCLMRTIARYLKPSGVMYCVQSANREGMAQFVQLLRSHAFTVSMQPVTSDSPVEGLLGHYSHAKDVGRGTGFEQREEEYLLFTIRREQAQQTGPQTPDDVSEPAIMPPTVKYLSDGSQYERGDYDVLQDIILPKPKTFT